MTSKAVHCSAGLACFIDIKIVKSSLLTVFIEEKIVKSKHSYFVFTTFQKTTNFFKFFIDSIISKLLNKICCQDHTCRCGYSVNGDRGRTALSKNKALEKSLESINAWDMLDRHGPPINCRFGGTVLNLVRKKLKLINAKKIANISNF